MGLELKTGSGLSLGSGLGLGLGNGHAYAAAGTILGSFTAAALIVGAAVLLVVGVKKVINSNKAKSKTTESKGNTK